MPLLNPLMHIHKAVLQPTWDADASLANIAVGPGGNCKTIHALAHVQLKRVLNFADGALGALDDVQCASFNQYCLFLFNS